MKNSSTLLLALAFLSILFPACFSPKPVVRVEPVAEPDKWNYGQAVLEAEKADILTSVSYAYSDKEFMVFHVEVTNWRDERLLVNPADISITIPDGGFKIPAIDPEQHMLDMELEASRREANSKNAAVVVGAVAVAAVAAAVITDNGNNNVENAGNNGVDVINVAPTVFIDDGVQRGAAPYPVEPWFWTDQTLRKTTLEKGEMVRGKVVFPRNDNLPRFAMEIPVEEIMFTFSFKQIYHWPE